MWLQTNVGFFSLAEKAQSIDREQLTIRARVRSDLEALQMIYLPGLTFTADDGPDGLFEATVHKASFAAAMTNMVKGISYSNFEDEVCAVQGQARAAVYANVQMALARLNQDCDQEHPMTTANQISVPHVQNHCAMVVSGNQVLVRAHMSEDDETRFLHLKGRVMGHPQHALIHHLYQITGYKARVAIPSQPFEDSPKDNWNYYVMPIDISYSRRTAGMQYFEWTSLD
jgi:hypothetical protein